MASSGSLNTSFYKDRCLAFSWAVKSQDETQNKTTCTYTLAGGGSGPYYYETRNIKLVIDGKTVYTFGGDAATFKTLYNGTVVTSGEFTLEHEVDGSREFTVYVEAGIYTWAVNCSGEDTFTLNDIPRASTLTASNGTLGEEQALTINRASSKFKHRLTYRCGDVAEYIAGGAGSYTTETSIKWTPRIGLAQENTTGTSVTVTLTLYTYNSDGAHVGTTQEVITCAIPVSVKPSVSIDWEDITGLAEKYGSPVQGLSQLKITLDETTSYGAKITTRTITANGATYTETPATTAVLTAAGSNKIAAIIKDQRGRQGSNSATMNVLAYSAPSISMLTVHRCNEDGTENEEGAFVKVTLSAKVTDLNGLNPAKYVLRYKEGESSEYGDDIILTEIANRYTVTDYSYIFAADVNKTYDVEVVASDDHGEDPRTTSASTAFTLLNWHPSGTGMGVGKVSEKENAVEFALDLYDKNGDKILGVGDLINLFFPVGSMVLRYDTINPGTIYPGTTWTQITARVLRAGSAGSIGAEGTLADGSGRTYIDVAVWRRTT